MALEVATYISQLVVTNPPGGDDLSTADDHLRLLKDVLQNQFPNFDQVAVSATPTEINGLAGATANTVAVFGALGVLESSTMTPAQLLQYVATLTISTVPFINSSGVIESSAITPTELGYLTGVTSNIQTQLTSVHTGFYDWMYQSYGDGNDGAIQISADADLEANIIQATTYELDVTRTLTLKREWTFIKATTSITINGIVEYNASDRAQLGKLLDGAGVRPGTPTGGGGGGAGGSNTAGSTGTGGDGTDGEHSGLADGGAGGAGGVSNTNGTAGTIGNVPTALAKEKLATLVSMLLASPGNGGTGGQQPSSVGSDLGGAGGDGAGLLILMAPIIILGASSEFNAIGDNGIAGVAIHTGGGGGGNGGVLILATPSLTDASTKVFIGGSGGAGETASPYGDGAVGGAGADGFAVTMNPDL